MAYSYKRITIPLSDQEQARLRDAARANYRNPRQQARLILLQALGMADPPDPAVKSEGAPHSTKATGATFISQSTTVR